MGFLKRLVGEDGRHPSDPLVEVLNILSAPSA
jgi:hypothetical protein